MFRSQDLRVRPIRFQQPADLRRIQLIWLPAGRDFHYAHRNPIAELGGYPLAGSAARLVAVHHQHQFPEMTQQQLLLGR